jgi:hypothetical protein
MKSRFAFVIAAAQFGVTPARVPVVTCTIQETWKREIVAEDSRNYESTRLSDGGKYRVSIRPPDGKVPMQRMHSWVLHVEGAGGAAVDSASICIDGGMPEHGHGLPTRPAVTEALHHGDYRIDGMKFSMGGWWVVKFTIDAAAGVDSIRFNLKLP